MNDETPEPAAVLEELRRKAAQAEEYLELAKRARADFVNYQDRVRREREDWKRQALEGFLRDLLPATDGFALARFDDPKLMEAVRLIEKEILRVLAKHRVVPIEALGKVFDPLCHEVVAVEEKPDFPGGTIVGEVQRGWTLEGKVLFAARVAVARAPGPSDGSPPASASTVC